MASKSLSTNRSKESIQGIWYSILAFVAWGFLPLYWKALKEVQPEEILAHRIVWSLVFVAVILVLNGRWKQLRKVLRQPRKLLAILVCSLLIGVNWFIYIWAVNANHVVEASLGYYINPLLSVFLGMIVLKERLSCWQLVSLFLACLGVIIITLHYGSIPWIALSLAITFGLYGLFKKMANVDSLISLALETAVLAPVALGYLLFLQVKGSAALGSVTISTTMLLIGSGVATALPLLWFAMGTQRVALSTVGFIQYLAPSISLMLGIFVFKESFTSTDALSFGFIWSALVVYTFSKSGFLMRMQPFKYNIENTEGR